MTAASGRLALHPEKCDQCGRCMRACPRGALRIASGYIYVDVVACDGCFACGEACSSGAITRAGSASSSSVVVGSRAEAKALRKSAAKAASAPATRPARRQSVDNGVSTPKVVQERESSATGAGPSQVVWSLAEAGAVAGIVFAGLLGKDALLASQYVTAMPEAGRMAARAVVLGTFYALLLGALGFIASRRGVPFALAFRLRVRHESESVIAKASVAAAWVSVLVLGTRAVSLAWGALAQAVGWNPPHLDTNTLTGLFGDGGMGLAISILLVVVVGPLTEELIFRGVIASWIGSRWNDGVALVASAAIFAVYHITPWLWVPMFTLGLATGWLALRCRTLWPPIVLHSLYNVIVVAAAFWLDR